MLTGTIEGGWLVFHLFFTTHMIQLIVKKEKEKEKDESLLIFSVDLLLTDGVIDSSCACVVVSFFVLNLSSGLCCDGYGTENIHVHYIPDI